MWFCLKLLKNILPALGNEFVIIIKDSSLFANHRGYGIVGMVINCCNNDSLDFDAALFAAFYYLIVTTAMTAPLKQMEQRLGEGRK